MNGLFHYTLLLISVLFLASCAGEKAENPPNTASDMVTEPDPSSATGAARTGTAVLFLGDSITAGYGLDPAQAFPALLQQRADSLGWPVEMINGGLSGETSAGGLRRIGWLLRRPVDVVVLELGGNDGLRGIDLDDTRSNLLGIVDSVRARYPEARFVVAGMMIPPNLGPDYTRAFRDLYPDVARQTGATLIPFILEGVGGVERLMQADGIHPTADGHAVMAETVWPYLEPLIKPGVNPAP